MVLFQRVKNIIVSPNTEWIVIKSEVTSLKKLFLNYIMILALIPVIASYIGFSIFGISYGFGTYKLPFFTAISYAVVSYISSLFSVFIQAVVVDSLAKHFKSSKNMVDSLKTVAYSNTIIWIVGIVSIFHQLAILQFIASFYAAYLFYLGLKIIKEVPKEKMLAYFIAIIILSIIINIIAASFSSSILVGNSLIENMTN